MKLIHTSDLHIDSPLTSRFDLRTARERRLEISANFDRLILEAIAVNACGIIISGDLFDTEAPSKRAVEGVLHSIRKAKEISFFYLGGNHERSAIRDCGIELPENLFIFGDEWTYFKIGEIQIAGRSNLSPGAFDSLRFTEQTAIAVLHGALEDRPTARDVISRKDAATCGARYIALGHYHTYRKESLTPFCTAVYSGTPEGRGFDEAGNKGYVIINCEHGKVTHEFVEFAKRTLHIVDINITGVSKSYEVDDLISSALRSIPRSDIVRVRLIGSRLPTLTDTVREYESRHGYGYYYLEVADDTVLDFDESLRLGEGTVAGQFVRLVLDSDELTEEKKKKIITCGLSALGLGG